MIDKSVNFYVLIEYEGGLKDFLDFPSYDELNYYIVNTLAVDKVIDLQVIGGILLDRRVANIQ